jgi:ATP adenylyltransferase
MDDRNEEDRNGTLLSVFFAFILSFWSARGLVFVTVTSLALILLVALSPSPSDDTGTIVNQTPLRVSLADVSRKAERKGAVVAIPISPPSVMNEEGVAFQITWLRSEAMEALAKKHDNHKMGALNDPFDASSLDMRLVVDSVGSAHTLILNKFRTFPMHALVITNHFASQVGLLTAEDLGAWFVVVRDVDALGFFNSGRRAGASQVHRHMQVIPRGSLCASLDTSALPLEAILPVDDSHSDSNSQTPNRKKESEVVVRLGVVESLHDIRHAFALLDRSIMAPRGRAAGQQRTKYLHRVYSELLAEIGVLRACTNSGICPPHNLLLTPSWMLAVRRREAASADPRIDVNALGFAGFFLAHNQSAVRRVEEIGPLALLRSVSEPTVAQEGR